MSDEPPKRTTAQFGAVTFREELEHWLRTRGKLFYIDLSEEQIMKLMDHAVSIHKRHGGR
jgi:hypothetical protein